MRLVIDNINAEELSENEEDAYLLRAMEEVKEESIMTDKETSDFRKWLKA